MRVILALIGLCAMGSCAHEPPAANHPQPKEPAHYAVLRAEVPGGALFCVEAPTLNSTLDEPIHWGTVCPWTVDEVRRMVARLRAAD